MDILMFGWEFPPIQSGGLGVACQGIVDGLIGNGHIVNLVLPKTHPKMQMFNPGQFNLLAAHESGGVVNVSSISSSIYSPYASAESYKTWLKETIEERKGEGFDEIYGKDIFQEVHRFAMQACVHATKTPHDVIHTHDWLTAEAGIQAKKLSDQPHVMHVHATEFDRSGDNVNQQVYNMERRGMENADRIIAVSAYTKGILMKQYGIQDWKIDVVHNAIQPKITKHYKNPHIEKKDKIVLFLGRMTMQKGPDYFLHMAKKVIDHMGKNVKFVMAGDGDMMHQVIEMSANLGIERNVLFAGFLKGEEIERAYSEADLYVMPSVSEPFGLTPLESIRHGTPVIISRQSGVSEVIKNALRVDFWDVDDMAHKVLSVLKYPALGNTLREHGSNELNRINWHDTWKAERVPEHISLLIWDTWWEGPASAKKFAKIAKKKKLDKSLREKIRYAIKKHSRFQRYPKTLEARLLRDVDGLDCFSVERLRIGERKYFFELPFRRFSLKLGRYALKIFVEKKTEEGFLTSWAKSAFLKKRTEVLEEANRGLDDYESILIQMEKKKTKEYERLLKLMKKKYLTTPTKEEMDFSW